MKRNYFYLKYAFVLLLGSCARIPDSDFAHLSDPISLDISYEWALNQAFFEEGGWPSEKWWEMFEDSELNSLIEQAIAKNPTIQQALARVSYAEEEAKKQRSFLFPHLSADFQEDWEYFSKNGFVRSFYPTMPNFAIPETVNQLDLTLNFNYEIDFFGKNRNLFRAALGYARAAQVEAKQATLIISTLIAQTYVELQTKIAQRKILHERLETRHLFYELAAEREKNGLDPSIPVLEREHHIYSLEQELIQMEKGIRLDQHMLCTLVGISPDSPIHPQPLTNFTKKLQLPSDLSSDLIARRPDLIAQTWRVEAAGKEIGAAKADFYPRVNLMAFAGLESLSFNKLFNLSSKEGGLVPAIHLPIFTAGRLRANLQSKVAKFNEETHRYNALILSAAREVADQIALLTATFDTVDSQLKVLETLEEQLFLQNLRYNQGINNYLTVLEREDRLFNQQIELYGYSRDYLLAILKLIKALGGGYRS